MNNKENINFLGQELIKTYCIANPNNSHIWKRFFVHVEGFNFLYIEGNNKEANIFLSNSDEVIEYNLTQDKHDKVIEWINNEIFELEEALLITL
jgi:hypothetical protein